MIEDMTNSALENEVYNIMLMAKRDTKNPVVYDKLMTPFSNELLRRNGHEQIAPMMDSPMEYMPAWGTYGT